MPVFRMGEGAAAGRGPCPPPFRLVKAGRRTRLAIGSRRQSARAGKRRNGAGEPLDRDPPDEAEPAEPAPHHNPTTSP